MPTINFTGLASGLDTRALIDAILEAERAPAKRLQQRSDLFSQRRAAFDDLASKLASFESALGDLGSARVFRSRTTTVSDESVLRASAGTGAERGIFAIEVSSLAAAHKLKSAGFAATDQGLVTQGTITIQSGDNEQITVDVDPATFNNSLEAIRDEINAADAGVRAAIIFNGSDYLLTVRAEESGTANALTISDTTNLNLDDVSNVVSAAADATLTVDGIDITSSSNTVSGVIPGVTLDLLSANVGTPVSLEVAQDVDGVVDAVESLVDEYNKLIDFFNAQNDKANPGALSGDGTLRGIQLRVQSLFTTGVEGIPLGQIRSLSTVGVSFEGRTGRATLDSSELRELLETNFDEVGDVFLSSGSTTNPRIRFVSATSATVAGSYDVQITTAAEAASVLGGETVTTLADDEDLTVSVTTSNGTFATTVSLTAGSSLSEIVDAINSGLGGAGVPAYASDDGGSLRLSSAEVGSAVNISVSSLVTGSGGSGSTSGFGSSASVDDGVDVAGTINGVAATASGRFLTGAEGTDVAGLAIQVNASPADVVSTGGDFGSVSYSPGLIGDLLAEVDALTRFDSGTLDVARSNLDAEIKRLGADIARVEERVLVREQRLIKVFAAAERAISALQAQQASLNG